MDVNGADRLAQTNLGDGYVYFRREFILRPEDVYFSCQMISCPAILNLTCDE